MENNPQFRPKYFNPGNNSEKKSLHQNLEEHTLSLRKKKINRQREYILPPELITDSSYTINIIEFEQKIVNEQLYIQYKNSNNEKDGLGLCFQMLLSSNIDLIKFSIAKIRDFLVKLEEKTFSENKYEDEFNPKLIKFLVELMFKNVNDFCLLSNICFILNKISSFLCKMNEHINNFCQILFEYLNQVLNLAKNISNSEPKLKNILYLLSNKIFLGSNDIIIQLEKYYPNYMSQIHEEINSLDETKFVKNMALISSLLTIINNAFFNGIYINYFFGTNINNGSDEIVFENILKFIQKLLNYSYQRDILEQELNCIQNFLYLFMDNDNLFQNKILKKKVKDIIYNLELEKKLVPMIYDNTVNDYDMRRLAMQILINAMYICPKKFCELLMENNIAEQIIKLENYFLSQTQFNNRLKHFYILLLDLIFNLIQNESPDIINDLSIENNCISLLFKLQKIPFYAKEIKNIIKIFNVLIISNQKYIHTLLITEGICELYKAILENGPNNEDIEIIVNNFITMVNSTENFMKENNGENSSINLLLMHLEKIGISEVLNNLKSRNDLSEASISAINEISSLFNHK